MIRDFLPGDYPHFLTLARAFYDSEAVLHPVSETNFRFTFDAILGGSPYMRGLLILAGDEPAGYALMSFTQSNEVGGLVVWLEELFILPEYQGHGLAREFFNFVDREYQGKAARFRLEVSPDNASLIAVYERLGFKKLDYIQMTREDH